MSDQFDVPGEGLIRLNGKLYKIHCGIPAPTSDYRLFQDIIDERQHKELDLSMIYERDFHHGTVGHNQLMLIAAMARLLYVIPVMLAEVKEE